MRRLNGIARVTQLVMPEPAKNSSAGPNLLIRSGLAFVEAWEQSLASLHKPSTAAAYRHGVGEFLRSSRVDCLNGISDVTPTVIRLWDQDNSEAGLKPATRRVRLAAVRYLFQELYRRGIVEDIPAGAVRASNVPTPPGPDPVATGVLEQLLAAIESQRPVDCRDRALIAMLINLVGGVSQLLSLDFKSVHKTNSEWRLDIHSGDDPIRTVVLGDQIMAYIEPLLAIHPGKETGYAPLFTSAKGRSGNLSTMSRIKRSDAYQIIRRRAEAAGLESFNLGPQALRNAGLSMHFQNGGGLIDGMQIAGHKSVKSTSRHDRRDRGIGRKAAESIKLI